MRYVALATDFDGTLARDGCVDLSTIEAPKRLSASGRRLVLVTGRELDDLRGVFDATGLFDLLVVENGAVLHRPSTGTDSQLNLRAQNLVLFMQLGDGVDDATWRHHLARGDYSRWIRGSIKDDERAYEVQAAPA